MDTIHSNNALFENDNMTFDVTDFYKKKQIESKKS